MTRLIRLVAMTLALGLVLTLPGFAQTPGDSDLEALKYYLAQGDQLSAQAELRRLRTAFPTWTPPADFSALKATEPSVEIDQIYRAIAAGDIAGARSIIAKTQTEYVGWVPPADMLALLNVTDAQQRFDAAVNGGSGEQAIAIASSNPELLRCDRVNNAWMLADAQAKLGKTADALATYRGVLTSCTNFPNTVATLEKANAIATDSQILELIGLVRPRFPSNSAALDALGARLAAGRGAPTAPPAPKEAATPAAKPAAQPSAPAVAGTAPPSPQSLPPVSQQPALPAVSSSRSYAGLPRSGDNRIGQVRSAAAAGAWADCASRSANPRSVDIVYERSWCVYNLDRPLEALAGFRLAADAGLGGTVGRDARFGMALSLLKAQMTDEAAAVAAATDYTHEQRVTVESIILNQRGVRAFQSKDFAHAIDYFNALEAMAPLPRDLAMLRGYAYLNLGDRRTALAQFETLHKQLATNETRAAMAAAR